MSLEKALQKLVKAIQSPPNPNMAPQDPGSGGGFRNPDMVLKVKCYTKGIRLQQGGPLVTHCICRAKGYRDGCIIKLTQGPCGGEDRDGYTITYPFGEQGPPCIAEP